MAKQTMFCGDLFIVYDNERYRIINYVKTVATKPIDKEYELGYLKMASIVLVLWKLGV